MSSRRVTIVTAQLLGYDRTGGVGTATAFLAIALARMGHSVEILYAGDAQASEIDPEWARLFEQSGTRIRMLPGTAEIVEPRLFVRIRAVELALRRNPPEVVIAHEFGAPAYTALRLRQLGLALESTLFVTICHGTRRWVKETNRNQRVSPDVLGESTLEQASVELSDAVVSPSAYLTHWMRAQGWKLPERTLVVPHLTRSGSMAEPPPRRSDGNGRVIRLVFFGRLEEGKGVRPFAAGLNALEPELLRGLELEFMGTATKYWSPERVAALLSETVTRALGSVRFETELDQQEALARLSRPGTLAVMPSLGDNSPNTVYECLERGIPFLASSVGGIPELIAEDDRARVLFEPTAEGVTAALRRALAAGDALRAARPSFDQAASLERWSEVVALQPETRPRDRGRASVDVIVVHRSSPELLSRCLAALERQTHDDFRTVVAIAGADVPAPDNLGRTPVVRSERPSVEAARAAGLEAGRAAWVTFLDEEDVPGEGLLQTLVRAQAASDADVVSCGLYLDDADGGSRIHVFPGQPGGLALLANGYGSVCLLRRSLLGELETPWPVEGDHDWPLLGRLSASGAYIVSVPAPLLTRRVRPGSLEEHQSDALLVADQLQRVLPDHLRSLARLAAGLAAESHRSRAAPGPAGIGRRAARVLRQEGVSGLGRRAIRRLVGGSR